MNRDLSDIIQAFATKEHKEVAAILHDKSKDSLIAILTGLLTQYFNDSNSSTLRELVVVTLGGFQPATQKLGYNGYRQITIGGG